MKCSHTFETSSQNGDAFSILMDIGPAMQGADITERIHGQEHCDSNVMKSVAVLLQVGAIMDTVYGIRYGYCQSTVTDVIEKTAGRGSLCGKM